HLFLGDVGGRLNALQLEAELVRVRRAAQRFVERDQSVLIQRIERLIERLHAVLRRALRDRVLDQLRLFFVLNAVSDIGGRDEHLRRRNAAEAVGAGEKAEGDDGLENRRELQTDLLLL